MDRSQAIEVALPGGFWPAGRGLVDHFAIRPLTGADEEWLLSRPPATPTAVVAAELLGRCADEHDPNLLLIGDRDYLLLQLRRMTLGDRFDVVVDCCRCKVPMDVAFESSDIPVESRPNRRRSINVSVREAGGETHRVAMRLPTIADINLAIHSARPESAVLAACVETVDGRRRSRAELGRVLDRTARARLDFEMRNRAPTVELAMRLKCPGCGHEFDFDVDLAGFVLEELRLAARHLWPEVNHIALHYHWSEEEILQLPRQRRRWYVSLINDSLRAAEAQ